MLPEGFVYLDEVVPGFCWDARYATDHNLTGAPLDGYRVNRIVGSRELAEALIPAAEYFAGLGYRLYGFDAYRPQRGVRSFVEWARRPEDGRPGRSSIPGWTSLSSFPWVTSRSAPATAGAAAST